MPLDSLRRVFRRSWYGTSLLLIGMVMAFLLTYRLGYWPAPWFDEGVNLHAAKSLVIVANLVARE